MNASVCSLVGNLYKISPMVIISSSYVSSLKPIFLYRGLGLSEKRPLHSETILNVSKLHSKLLFVIHQHFIPWFLWSATRSLNVQLCLSCMYTCTAAIQPVLGSTCQNHFILLVRGTTSKSWMPSFERWVGNKWLIGFKIYIF